jgi:hypothetical protein
MIDGKTKDDSIEETSMEFMEDQLEYFGSRST